MLGGGVPRDRGPANAAGARSLWLQVIPQDEAWELGPSGFQFRVVRLRKEV